jgi:glycosyltransferase involved in cell wall biosynthesis
MLADHECNSIACHEAMLCQLPVIVPNKGGLPEHVDDTCGRLVNINCQESIVSSVVSLASNKKLRDQLGHKARKKIKENLTWENSANTLLEHFKNQCKEI